MSTLDRKLLRDLWRLRGQVLAIALVIGAAMATLVLSLGTQRSLLETRDAHGLTLRWKDATTERETA